MTDKSTQRAEQRRLERERRKEEKKQLAALAEQRKEQKKAALSERRRIKAEERALKRGANGRRSLTREERASLRVQKREQRALEKRQKAENKKRKAEILLGAQESSYAGLYQLAKEQKPRADWVGLDNAALIFPATENESVASVFRLSAVIKEEVCPIALQKALNAVVPRFPTVVSAMKKGFFWFYLEPSTRPLVVTRYEGYPCKKIPIDSRHPAVRVLYASHEIAVEFYHTATDGNGGILFLNSLLAAYFEMKGTKIEDYTNCLNAKDRPRPEEMVDSFQQIADKVTKKTTPDPAAWQIQGTRLPDGMLVYNKGICSGSELHAVAKSKGATVTELLTACQIWGLQEYRRFYGFKKDKPVVISVPVNLRPLYGSRTVRNFVSMMLIEGKEGVPFDELLSHVKKQFAEQNTVAQFMGRINTNVYYQRHVFFRLVPLPLKYLVLRIVNIFAGDRKRTSSLSNLGVVKAPKEFEGKVLRYDFGFGPQKHDVVSLYTVTYNDVAVLTFSCTVKETYMQKKFFAKLSELGVSVAVESNLDLP